MRWRKLDFEKIRQKIEVELKLIGFSPNTIKMYVLYNRKFLEFINKTSEEVILDDIKYYLSNFVDRGLEARSQSLARAALKFFYDKMLKKNFFIDLKAPKVVRKLPEILTIQEMKKIFENTDSLRDTLILKFLYGCGMRVSEVISIKKENIDFDSLVVHIKSGKGNKDRFVKLPDSAIKDFSLYLKDLDSLYVFPGRLKGHINAKTAERALNNAAKKAKIKKKVYCHLLRHSYATHLLDSGLSIRYIQELLGHEHLETTQIYTKVSKERLKEIKSPMDQWK